MLIKANFFFKNFSVTGDIDVPKIKKRMCRKHFGLVAVLNHPKLSLDWFNLNSESILIKNAHITHTDGTQVKKEQIIIDPTQIIWAYEEDPKESAFFKKNFLKFVQPEDRVCLGHGRHMLFEGEFVPDVNEVALTRGKGFISLANASVVNESEENVPAVHPFIVVNSLKVKNMPQSVPLYTRGNDARTTALRRCS